MRIRIRLGKASKVARFRRAHRRLALMFAELLTPAALMAGVLALWSIASDFNWTNRFAIASGLFSHWQVWLAAAIVLALCSRALNRYGQPHDRVPS